MTYEQQLEALASFVDDWAVKQDKAVKGEFTSGDYVTWQLNRIFSPGHWDFQILNGPEIVTLNEANAYVRVIGRLTVRFADGLEAYQDDIGIWPLRATKANQGGTLENTAAERYETVEKAARTDCLKNAAQNLGTCFRPMTDLELVEAVKRIAYQQSNTPSGSAKKDVEELFGESPTITSPEPESAAKAEESAPEPPETAQEGMKAVGDMAPAEPIIRGYKLKLQRDAQVARERGATGKPSPVQRGLMNGMVKKIVGDEFRKLVLAWIFDYDTAGFSTDVLDAAEVKIILDELKPEKVDGRNYEPTMGFQVFKWLLHQAQIDFGQMEMFAKTEADDIPF